ncbi:NADH pyrophosphatase [Vibrio sp. qd031]|uniref:NAD(+) diphosphatase n=1 Tax=Vibrio sp. qd031 TaxID=1603038 RepID=UPI000A120F7C|nr:NAD(+) diphosphatase [Vibrio sp. qd031]ORT50763.1 NADH pyrophosphatase [Vibrio sp. qd031]
MLRKSNHEQSEKAYWLSVLNTDIATRDDELLFGTSDELNIDKSAAVKLDHYQGHQVYWLPSSDAESLPSVEYMSMRGFLTLDKPLFHLASKAMVLENMLHTQRFCSSCGGRTHFNRRELSMQCSDCRTQHYPRIFPCIIVAVVKQGKILLAKHHRHKKPFYTVLAGYLESGETLEECVEREVYEESQIKVKKIEYVGSQPWAFSNSLMVGFTAEYESGEIKIDQHELEDAQWFDFNNLPEMAPPGTIARELIDLATGKG